MLSNSVLVPMSMFDFKRGYFGCFLNKSKTALLKCKIADFETSGVILDLANRDCIEFVFSLGGPSPICLDFCHDLGWHCHLVSFVLCSSTSTFHDLVVECHDQVVESDLLIFSTFET